MTDRTSDVLNRAADLIEERGWTQGPKGWQVGGPLCALGGLSAAMDIRIENMATVGTYCHWEALDSPAVIAVAEYVGVPVGSNGEGVYRWNDEDDRTAEEVIATLRAAAVIEAAKETPATIAAATLTAADEHADVPSAVAAILVAGLGAAAAIEAAGVRS